MKAITHTMDLASYRALVRDLPVPSGAQRDAFAFYVSRAHSWYKRIPLLGPGEPFVLFLDPAAGLDRLTQADGAWTTAWRAKTGFHYSAIPTQEYRDRFGHLAFASGQAVQAGSVAGGRYRIETGFGACLIDAEGALRELPKEVEAGAVWLTGLIHPMANQPAFWWDLAHFDAGRSLWPEESGGADAFARIQARCRELEEDDSRAVPTLERGMDEIFADLVEPERQRQRRMMVGAIERLLRLLNLAVS